MSGLNKFSPEWAERRNGMAGAAFEVKKIKATAAKTLPLSLVGSF
jgi:hypothetical protein